MTATAPATTTRKLTYEEYLKEFRTQASTRLPCEILDGVVKMPPSPRYIHQRFYGWRTVSTARLWLTVGPMRFIPSSIQMSNWPLKMFSQKTPCKDFHPPVVI